MVACQQYNDICFKQLETTIKQTDEEKRRAVETALRLKSEYKPLKESIICLRESIGLDRLEDGENESVIEEFMLVLVLTDNLGGFLT